MILMCFLVVESCLLWVGDGEIGDIEGGGKTGAVERWDRGHSKHA